MIFLCLPLVATIYAYKLPVMEWECTPGCQFTGPAYQCQPWSGHLEAGKLLTLGVRQLVAWTLPAAVAAAVAPTWPHKADSGVCCCCWEPRGGQREQHRQKWHQCWSCPKTHHLLGLGSMATMLPPPQRVLGNLINMPALEALGLRLETLFLQLPCVHAVSY
jgi:hypothetical protein